MTTIALGLNEREELVHQSETGPAESPAEQVTHAFRELHKSVYWFLHGMLANAAAAEDLTQETFLRLLRELHRGTLIENQRAWIFRVASNLALNYKKRPQSVETVFEAAEEFCADESPGPEETVLQNETLRLLSAGMARLSVQERQCLLLRSEGLRYREIGEALNLRVSTVATFITRAVRKLAEEING